MLKEEAGISDSPDTPQDEPGESPEEAEASVERARETRALFLRFQRQRDPAGAAAQLEDRAVGSGGDAAPERYVASAERLSVLPVIERRVLVPALPAFTFHCRVL